MLDHQTLELTMLEIARKSGRPLDRHTIYEVRNGVRNALAAKERHRKRMNAPDYQWKKPASPRS
ncbi:hypothetical protein KCS96_002167 [Salmonella enterica subsp. enterica serovar Taksony]|nr:hypothetical protein [Salmonella enterica subsp. enterica serovar Havana]EHK7993440.1 hypothetical protein [Salmonella enterica subsp. enterica serovar Taksony]